MKVTQEKLPASQIGLEIEIPAPECQKAYEKVVQNMLRAATIPGFRKGKIPRKVLLQRIGTKRIKAEALEGLIQSSLEAAIEQESISAIGNYQLKSDFEDLLQQYQPEASVPLTFSASVDVPPEVRLGDYENLSVKAEEVQYKPQQVDDYLEQLQVEHATLVPVEDRPVQMGDLTVVDYQGRLHSESGEKGELIPGAQATDAQVELKEGLFIEDLIQGIVAMEIGETKEVPVQFPQDYPKEDLAGAQATFTVTLKEIKEKELPDLDDDFAEEVSEFETMAELRETLESRYREQAETATKNNIEEALAKALVEVTDIELPESLIQREVDSILTQKAMQLERYGMDVRQLFTAETMPQLRQNTHPDAIANLKRTKGLEKVAQQQSIQPDEEAITKRIKEITEQLSDREFDADRLKEVVTEELTQEKTLQWLQEKAAVELVPEGSLQPEPEELEELEELPTTSEEVKPAPTVNPT